MSRLAEPRSTTRARTSARTLLGAAVAVVLAAATAACGSTPTASADLAPIERPTTTRAAATTSTVAASTTTSTTTTTTSTTLLPRQQTQPVPPPQDPRAPESNPPIGQITITKIGLDTALEEGIRLTTLDRGPGHWPGSAMPGELGNVVVGGHRTSHGAEFRHLDALVPGDEMVLTTAAGSFTYVVTGTEVVGPEALWIVDPTDTATATLFACHPLGSTAQRIVVSLALRT